MRTIEAEQARERAKTCRSIQLSPEALDGLIEEFILREGTDYGDHEYSLEQKKQHIIKQLNNKSILIMYDPSQESTTLIRTEIFKYSYYNTLIDI